ncbi:MAG: hypothetical protein LQ337_005199 [Flavoplaca oasis]|nr:MAG: hypothetical protein LQ337_005199 [Flavoplaca oasis]
MPESKTGSANKPSAVDKATTVEGDKDDRKSTVQKSGTWSKSGTWRRGSKATPVTQVAKESIFAATDKASELVAAARNPITKEIVTSKRSPSTYLSRSIQNPDRSSSFDASTKKAPVENASLTTPQPNDQTPAAPSDAPGLVKGPTLLDRPVQENPATKGTINLDPSDEASPKEAELHDPKANSHAPLWRAWFSRHEEPSKPEPQPLEATSAVKEFTTDRVENPIQRRVSNPELATKAADQAIISRPWLGFWGTARQAKFEPIDTAVSVTTTDGSRPQNSSGSNTPKTVTDNPKSGNQPTSTAKSPGWAFWSRDTPKTSESNATDSKIGEMALAGSPSQSHPERAILDQASGVLGKRPRSVESAGKNGTPQSQRQKIQKEVSRERKDKVTSDKPIEGKTPENNCTKNLLLPQITATYRPVQRLSLIQSLSRLWYYDKSSGVGSVELLDNPLRIKRALTIGVHGYFPAPLIRSVLGQPTGTSIRFADGAANAIHKWTESQGYTCDIEKVALEGEGKILERVDVLWKLLLNWTENIRRADFIMVACHSQGVPVAIMLIAKLLEFGCVQDAKKIGVCAMAGVNLGPFVDYKSRWIGASARELFDFAQAESQVSKDYHAALTTILSSGVRVAYVGSIDDQLVSLDSSTFGTIDHPNIHRAVFVDGRVHAPDFLTKLVGFALKLRNLGVADHGLIRELSSPLAGSLYSGEGHSRIYEDDAVY